MTRLFGAAAQLGEAPKGKWGQLICPHSLRMASSQTGTRHDLFSPRLSVWSPSAARLKIAGAERRPFTVVVWEPVTRAGSGSADQRDTRPAAVGANCAGF